MASSYRRLLPIIAIFVVFLLLVAAASPVLSASMANSTLRPGEELLRYRRIRAHLKRLNKPSLKMIKSPDGDLIDCVPSHLQPAFDHPKLGGQKPLDPPPERPKGYLQIRTGTVNDTFQAWMVAGESCPEGTVPIRRTTEEDMLRATSIRRFGRKPAGKVRRDSTSSGHEHAVGYVMGDQYFGAKASLNVWAPRVTNPTEFSLSQIWVISGSFGNDLNTIEAGWQITSVYVEVPTHNAHRYARIFFGNLPNKIQGMWSVGKVEYQCRRMAGMKISPQLYGDNNPRFFTYWTTDAYQETGCYNLLCSGFVQTTNKIAIGAAIKPKSMYNGGQFDISLLIWKDPKHGHWWLEFGRGLLVGYWPSFLFNHLAGHANMVQFGGEIVNCWTSGSHTSTQMGSGHFAGEGFRKAAYFRNLQVVDWDNSLIPSPNLRVLADRPYCYDIQGGINRVWGNYFYYGGPGRNMRCP